MKNIFHLAMCWIHVHFTFNLPSCKSTNWMKPRMLQKPLGINATCVCPCSIIPPKLKLQFHR